jgi:hypothetical protein
MVSDDLDNRFNFHPAATAERRDAHERVRDLCGELAHELNNLLPDGREKSVVVTRLEEVMFWANASLARQPE